MIREMSQCRCTMLERSSYFKFVLTHAVWGTKLSLHFDHGPDVGSSDGRAVCSTLSQVMGSSSILAWNFFLQLGFFA